MLLFATLFLLAIFVSIYDYRHHEIPNWVTWPLLVVGIYAHAPGTLMTDASSVLLVLLWFFLSKRVGAGDVKLWLALLWALPSSTGDIGSLIMFSVITVTAGFQVILRRWHRGGGELDTKALPAAWRTVAFMAFLTVVLWIQTRYV